MPLSTTEKALLVGGALLVAGRKDDKEPRQNQELDEARKSEIKGQGGLTRFNPSFEIGSNLKQPRNTTFSNRLEPTEVNQTTSLFLANQIGFDIKEQSGGAGVSRHHSAKNTASQAPIQKWTITKPLDLQHLGAALAPAIMRLGKGAIPSPMDNALLDGLKNAQWSNNNVRDDFLNTLASDLESFAGLSNAGNPAWEPKCNSGPSHFGSDKAGSFSHLWIQARSKRWILSKLPSNPQPYILEIAGLYAIDASMKVAASEFGLIKSNPLDLIEGAISSLVNAGSNMAQDLLSGKKIDPAKKGKQLGNKIVKDFIKAAIDFLKGIISGIVKELGRRQTELDVYKTVQEGLRLAAQNRQIQITRGQVTLSSDSIAIYSPVGSLGYYMPSQHKDGTPAPLSGWGQVADKLANFLGGVYPGPLFAAYRTAVGGSFWLTTRQECSVSYSTLQEWQRSHKTNGTIKGTHIPQLT